MGEKDERLELTLSLTQSTLPLNYSQPSRHTTTASPNNLFHLSDWNSDLRSFQRGIDVNQTPATVNYEEEPGVSSPNSTISSLRGKKRKGEEVSEDNDGERDSCSPGSGEDDVPGGVVGGESRRKKLRLSKEQSMLLEQRFIEEKTLNPKQKLELAKKLKLTLRQVEVWFQNRRARTKMKQKEVDCEYMKKWCEKLSRENKRLEKEILELRALPLCPHCHPIPPPVNPDRSIIPWTLLPLRPRPSNSPPKAVTSGEKSK